MSRVKKINFFLAEASYKNKPNQNEDLFFSIYFSKNLKKPVLYQIKLKKTFYCQKSYDSHSRAR